MVTKSCLSSQACRNIIRSRVLAVEFEGTHRWTMGLEVGWVPWKTDFEVGMKTDFEVDMSADIL